MKHMDAKYALTVSFIITLIFFAIVLLSNEVVMAQDEQCGEYTFSTPFFPGESCEDIYNQNPDSRMRPGFYWITDGPSQVYCGMGVTGSSCEDIFTNNPDTGADVGYYLVNGAWTFCDMAPMTCNAGAQTGGWIRIGGFDTSAGDSCPSGWLQETISTRSVCRLADDAAFQTCSSIFYPTNGSSYQRVCGRARGYQKGRVSGFYPISVGWSSINVSYFDGLSITYGGINRQHIWSFVVGQSDFATNMFNCPCTRNYPGPGAPSFVGNNFFCESGATDIPVPTAMVYSNDPLWDGNQCAPENCCNNTEPWFYRELDALTTSDIETRFCRWDRYEIGSALIDQLEIFVQ